MVEELQIPTVNQLNSVRLTENWLLSTELDIHLVDGLQLKPVASVNTIHQSLILLETIPYTHTGPGILLTLYLILMAAGLLQVPNR